MDADIFLQDTLQHDTEWTLWRKKPRRGPKASHAPGVTMAEKDAIRNRVHVSAHSNSNWIRDEMLCLSIVIDNFFVLKILIV